MRRFLAVCFVFVLAVSISLVSFPAAASEPRIQIKPSLLGADQYHGVKLGRLFFLKLEITNTQANDYEIGDYFRVLMHDDTSQWNQFAMAACGPTNLKAKNIRSLQYGSGAGTIAQKAEGKQAMALCFGGSNVIQDSSLEKEQNFAKWWPRSIAAKGKEVITWPVFWFSDTSVQPLYLASPVFTAKGGKFSYWVSFDGKDAREIRMESRTLAGIIKNPAEPQGLRSAAARWLMETGQANEKILLEIAQDAKAPKTLGFRSMQALMLWGSPGAVEEFFQLWKSRKLSPVLDGKNTQYYFTWSEHDQDDKYSGPVKAGKR